MTRTTTGIVGATRRSAFCWPAFAGNASWRPAEDKRLHNRRPIICAGVWGANDDDDVETLWGRWNWAGEFAGAEKHAPPSNSIQFNYPPAAKRLSINEATELETLARRSGRVGKSRPSERARLSLIGMSGQTRARAGGGSSSSTLSNITRAPSRMI